MKFFTGVPDFLAKPTSLIVQVPQAIAPVSLDTTIDDLIIGF